MPGPEESERGAERRTENPRTFNSLNEEEKKTYRVTFIEKNRETLLPFLEQQEIFVLGRQFYTTGHEVDAAQCSLIVDNLVSFVKNCFSTMYDGSTGKTASGFAFGDASILVDCELESAMQLIEDSEMCRHKELFRESAPVKEINEICHTIDSIKKSYFPVIGTTSGSERKKLVKELCTALALEMKRYSLLTVASVFKIVLKRDSPIFPSKYFQCYTNASAIEDPRKRVLICKFIITFFLSNEKREILEVVSCFLYALVKKSEKSALNFKNIAIIFTPLFFIDGNFSTVGDNFKEPLEKLSLFLEFFLGNSREIFLVESEGSSADQERGE